jgi:cytochrome P450
MDEIDDLLKRIGDISDKPVNVHRRLGSSVSNIVTLLITGKRYEYDDPTRVAIDDSFLSRGDGIRPNLFSPIFFFPILGRVLPYLPAIRAGKKRSYRMIDFFQGHIEHYQKNFDTENGNPTCFIEAYLKEMAENKTGKYFDLEHLIGSAFAFFAAGTSTMSDFLTWFLLYMMIHPVVQRKMRDEVDDVIGTKRVSTMYRDRMPYTEAVIQELHRVSSSLPSGIQHANAEDVNLEGYFLPKGTQIFLSSHAVHMDPDNFADPEEFIPERFISKEGKFIRDERIMSFGYGKRACPGEPIANTEIFLYMTSFLQMFEIEMPKGKKYTTAGVTEFLGRIPADMPVEVMFRRR